MYKPAYRSLAKSYPSFLTGAFSGRQAFSLTELLVVMAIVALLSSVSLPFTTTMLRGSQITQSIQTLQGALDLARQTAIAQNTFVWVAFADPKASDGFDQTSIAVISSTTGGDVLDWTLTQTILSGNQDLTLSGKVQNLNGIKIFNAGEVSFTGLEAVDPGAVNSLSTVNLDVKMNGKTRTFTRAIQFSPTGEARVKTYARLIELGIKPGQGEQTSKNMAVVRLTGVSGKAAVSRPE